MELPFCGPRISHDAFPLDGKTYFLFLFGENLIFRKKLGVATYFCFIFEGKNKIRKKNPNCELIHTQSVYQLIHVQLVLLD